MESLLAALAVGVTFALIFGIGEWIFRRLDSALSASLHAGWRWLALPMTAALSAVGFLVLRPLIDDQPRTPLWFVLGFTAIALLVAAAYASAQAFIQLCTAVIALVRRFR